MILTSLENGLRIRTGPGTSYLQVVVAPISYNAGQTTEVITLDGTGSPEQWAKEAESRWINVWHNGYQNASLSGTLPPPAGGLPTIQIHQVYNAAGYPEKIIDETWTPNA